MASFDLKAVITAQDNASSTISKVGSSFTNLGANVAKYGALAVGAFGAAATFAIKNAADVQMLRQSFDTLLGSADKGRKMFSDLQKMANITPFETQDLAKAASTLLAYGVSTEKILPTVQRLGDISLGNRNKFDMLALAFSQVAANGKLMGQDLLQMTSQGFNPLQIIAEKTGKTMATLRDEMSKGQITFAMVDDAFTTATSAGGKFYKGMENGSKTLTGVMSTLSDNVKITARSIVGLSETGDVIKGGLFDKVSNAISKLIAYLDANKEAIVEVATAFLTTLVNAITIAIGWIVTIIKFLNEHRELALALAIAVGTVLTGAFMAWAASVIAATWPLLAIIAAVTALAYAAIFLVNNWSGITGFFLNIWNTIVNWFRSLPGAISGAMSGVWNAITSPFRSAFEAIKGYWNNTVGKIKVTVPSWVPGVGGKSFGFPSFKTGGIMPYEGLAYLHAGERVIPANQVNNSSAYTINFYGNINNTDNKSLDEIGQRLARQLSLAQQGI